MVYESSPRLNIPTMVIPINNGRERAREMRDLKKKKMRENRVVHAWGQFYKIRHNFPVFFIQTILTKSKLACPYTMSKPRDMMTVYWVLQNY
jgi:hypothetical protein